MKYLALSLVLMSCNCGVDGQIARNGLASPPEPPNIDPIGIVQSTGDIIIPWATYLAINKYLLDADDWIQSTATCSPNTNN
jgi:hypothetical protein